MKVVEKRRLNVSLPVPIYDRLERDFFVYGVSKSSIVQTALMEYYQRMGITPPVSSDKQTLAGGCETP